MSKKAILILAAAGAALGIAVARAEQQHSHEMPMQHHHEATGSAPEDARPVVHFPPQLRIHTLANMRDHLLALQEIQEALAREEFDKAGAIAEQRLGMSSLKLHGAHEVAQYMPDEMRNIGTEMHRSASRFAAAAQEASVTRDMGPVLAGLAGVTRQCVACHAGYRVQ